MEDERRVFRLQEACFFNREGQGLGSDVRVGLRQGRRVPIRSEAQGSNREDGVK